MANNITAGSPMNNGDTASASYLNNWLQTSTVNGVSGSTSGGSQTTGWVGEIVDSLLASTSSVALTMNTTTNLTSITLTAGAWDIDAIAYVGSGPGYGQLSACINMTNGTSMTLGTQKNFPAQVGVGSSGNSSSLGTFTIHPAIYRMVSSSGTTAFLNVLYSQGPGGTPSAYGYIRATRVY